MRVCLACALVLISLGCDSQRSAPVSPVSPTQTLPGLESVTIEGPALVYWRATASLQARLTLADGRTMISEKVNWVSSAPATASVDESGTVAGMASGEAVISGTVGTVTGHFSVRVLPDYHGAWLGLVTQVSCKGHYCSPSPKSWSAELRLEQSGGTLSGRLFYSGYIDDKYGYVYGHVEPDGTLIIDRGSLDKKGYLDDPIREWKARLEADGNTMTGSYVQGWNVDTLQATLELNLRRSQ